MVAPLQPNLRRTMPVNPNYADGGQQYRGFTPGMRAMSPLQQIPQGGRVNTFAAQNAQLPQGAAPQMAQSGMMYTGGSPNFDERTGQYRTLPVNAPRNLAATSGMSQDVMPRQTMQSVGQSQPQYGLSGAESAFETGLMGGLSALQQGYGAAMGNVNRGIDLARNAALMGAQGLTGGGASAGFASASKVDPNTGQQLFGQAAQGVGDFVGAGRQAQQQQLALSGALGQDAFNQAMMSNPGTDLLKREAMDAVINQAAATGGLGSGNVLKALQDRATGLAAQDLQNQYNRAAGLSQQGLQAAGQQGQFLSQAGQQMGQLAGLNAQLGTQASIANAGNQTQAGIASANNATQAQIARANLMQQAAGQGIGLLGQAAGFANQGGLAAANMFGTTGNSIANARMRAGEQIAGNVQNTAGGLANLQNQQGLSLAQLLGGNIGSIADLYRQQGVAGSSADFNLGQLLSNLAVGQGGQLSQLQAQIGAANAAGQIGQANAVTSGLGNLLGIMSMSQGSGG